MVSHRPKQSPADDTKLQEKLNHQGNIPTHIAIIMDGNGRWAKKRGLPRIAGHKEGVESVRDIVEACGQLGVKHLTLYAFSTENWKRPKNEVSMLMRLLMRALRDETDKLYRNNVRVHALGNIGAMPQEVQDELFDAFKKTEENTGLHLYLALSYSGRWDITETIRRIGIDIKHGKLEPQQISEHIVSQYLSTKNIPDPDLLIRTSGEFRISNFLLWELAYSEIYISPVFWPDFRRHSLYEAIADYQQRERRFGLVSAQVQKPKPKTSYTKRFLKHVSGL